MKALRALALIAVLAAPAEALAWGNTGHRIVGVLGMEALPADLPAFLRHPDGVATIGELAREPDRWKGAGKTHDSDRDAGHFIDVDDAGLVMGGPPLSALPPTRAEYETLLRAAGTDAWKAGYLYYSLIDGWQQVVKDLGYWRVLVAAEKTATPERAAWYRTERARREALILRDVGVWAHYVGDGSQPLHTSVHYNGWGEFPNPAGYTLAKVHGPFEGDFVRDNVDPLRVRAAMAPPADCGCPIEQRTARYLAETLATTIPFYELEKAGGLKEGDLRGRAFAEQRLAAGASELRDLLVAAWKASQSATVGWPVVKVSGVEAGTVDPYDSLYGKD